MSADDARWFVRDHKPYAVPVSLDALAGPAFGSVVLPLSVYWADEHTVVDVGDFGWSLQGVCGAALGRQPRGCGVVGQRCTSEAGVESAVVAGAVRCTVGAPVPRAEEITPLWRGRCFKRWNSLTSGGTY